MACLSLKRNIYPSNMKILSDGDALPPISYFNQSKKFSQKRIQSENSVSRGFPNTNQPKKYVTTKVSFMKDIKIVFDGSNLITINSVI